MPAEHLADSDLGWWCWAQEVQGSAASRILLKQATLCIRTARVQQWVLQVHKPPTPARQQLRVGLLSWEAEGQYSMGAILKLPEEIRPDQLLLIYSIALKILDLAPALLHTLVVSRLPSLIVSALCSSLLRTPVLMSCSFRSTKSCL